MISRFSYGKYQDLVIKTFHKLSHKNKSLRLYLVGEGKNLKKW